MDEEALRAKRQALVANLQAIEGYQEQLNALKSILVHSGPRLVQEVGNVLRELTGFEVDSSDEFREDLKLRENGKPVMVVEVKGVNRGIGREQINQADSHRERSGFPPSFPALLVVNTNNKQAQKLSDKDQSVDKEQVVHASKLGILVLRTLDLLRLLRLRRSGKLSETQVREVLLGPGGWLEVDSDGYTVNQ